jgi:16S rRNA (uracil1498-N3)-methyltransferase
MAYARPPSDSPLPTPFGDGEMIPRLYTPQALASGAVIELDAASAHHALRVLRLGPGAPVELFDGDGRAADATILSTKPGSARIERIHANRPAPALQVTLAQCISASEKMDWTIEKAVELGVSGIVPLQSQKAIVKLTAERSAKRREHWQRLILAACAQCGQNRVPALEEVSRLEEWLDASADEGPGEDQGERHAERRVLRLILDPRAAHSLPAVLARHEAAAADDVATRSGNRSRFDEVWLLCGPESGFSDSELSCAGSNGWIAASLGPRVLRTETAGLAGLAILQGRWGDLG